MVLLFVGEADDWMSELFAIYSISSVVGIFIGLSSKVRIKEQPPRVTVIGRPRR